MKLASLAALLLLVGSVAPAQTHRPRKSTQAPEPAAATSWPIEALTVEGNHNYTAEQILAVAGLRVGQTGGKTQFDAARERLAATGAFDNVGYRFAPAKDGKGYDATFEVTELGQLYPLRFEDLPATDAQLRAWLKQKDPFFGEKIPATKPALDHYLAWITEFLAARDYHEPVSVKLASDPTADLIVVFRPAKARPNVAHVTFTGTGDLPSGLLQTAMFGVAVGVPYTEQVFRLLLDTTIRPLYEARGMIRVAFPKIETSPAQDVDGIVVAVVVDPGPVYKLGKVKFRGSDLSSEELVKLASLKSGQAANFDQVKAAQEKVAQALRRSGYLQAASEVERDVNDTDHTVNITFQINPGPQFTLARLDIVGLDIETEPVIRKMWTIMPGNPFNPEYPDHFLNRVKDGGVFDYLKTTRSETKVNAKDNTVNVTLYFNK